MADNCRLIEENPVAHSPVWAANGEDIKPQRPHMVVVGLSHRTASLELRERLAFRKEDIPEALSRLKEQAGEGVILSTCNRIEIYSVGEDAGQLSRNLRRFLTEYHGVSWEEIEPSLYEFVDAEAAKHLFQVAGGLDSMVIGEWQILDQVRNGLTAAFKANSDTLPLTLSRLFHSALQAGRRIREDARANGRAASISDSAVGLVRRLMGRQKQFNLLVIGAGEVGELVARGLRTGGAANLVIANRTLSRGEAMAQLLGGKAVSLDQLESSLRDADVVVTAADSRGFILSPQMVRCAVGVAQKDLLLVDLAVPRNVDPQVGGMDHVRLYDIDDLPEFDSGNPASCDGATSRAEGVINEELDKFLDWWHSLEAVPLIKKLRQQAESIRQQELSRSLRKLTGLAPEQLELVDALTRSIVNKLLHHPITSLKQEAGRSGLMLSRRASPDSLRLADLTWGMTQMAYPVLPEQRNGDPIVGVNAEPDGLGILRN